MRRMFSEKQLDEMMKARIRVSKEKLFSAFQRKFTSDDLDLDNHNNGDIIVLDTDLSSWNRIIGNIPLTFPMINPYGVYVPKLIMPLYRKAIEIIGINMYPAKLRILIILLDKEQVPSDFTINLAVFNMSPNL